MRFSHHLPPALNPEGNKDKYRHRQSKRGVHRLTSHFRLRHPKLITSSIIHLVLGIVRVPTHRGRFKREPEGFTSSNHSPSGGCIASHCTPSRWQHLTRHPPGVGYCAKPLSKWWPCVAMAWMLQNDRKGARVGELLQSRMHGFDAKWLQAHRASATPCDRQCGETVTSQDFSSTLIHVCISCSARSITWALQK